jgi:hypothetical protein
MSSISNIAIDNQEITFDSKSGLITIKGIFITENPQGLFENLNQKIDNYLIEPTNDLTLDFKIEYFNTNMSIIIRNLIKKLHDNKDKINLKIRWYFENEDEDMEETGEEFKSLFDDINYELIGVDYFK